MVPNLATGTEVAQRLSSLPQVSQTMTRNSLVPSD
jgi:hypothetical protein